MTTPHHTPLWQVTLGGRNITGRIAPRLMNLSIASQRDQTADQLDMALTDHDGLLELPRTGVTVAVALGWKDGGLVDMGTFVVDEIEHAGAPDHITVRARSAAVSSQWRQKRQQSWDRIALGDLVDILAGRNHLTPRCADALAGIILPHIDQTNESDLNLLTRIGKQHDAVATVKAGCLLMAPIGSGTTATGLRIPGITLARHDGDQHRYHVADREAYTGVRAYWQDAKGAKQQQVTVGDATTLKTLRGAHANAQEATAAAKAEWQRIQRGKATFSLTLAKGRADIYPDMPVTLTGFKPGIDGGGWLVKRVQHRLNDSGFTTQVECETGNAAAPEISAGS